VVFTGGIGEHAAFLRQKICEAVTQIGLKLDYGANKAAIEIEAEISTQDSKVKVFVIPTNEQVAIAKDTYELTKAKTPNGAYDTFNSPNPTKAEGAPLGLWPIRG